MKRFIYPVIVFGAMVIASIIFHPNINEIVSENFLVILFLFTIAHFLKLNINKNVTVVGDVGAFLMAIFTLSLGSLLLMLLLFSLINFMDTMILYFLKHEKSLDPLNVTQIIIIYIVFLCMYLFNNMLPISELSVKYIIVFLLSEILIFIVFIVRKAVLKSLKREIIKGIKYYLTNDLFFATFFFPFIYFHRMGSYELYNIYLINVIIFYFIIYFLVKNMWEHVNYLFSLIRLHEFANSLSSKEIHVNTFYEIKNFLKKFLGHKIIEIVPANSFIPPDKDKSIWNIYVDNKYLSKLLIIQPLGGEFDIFTRSPVIERERTLIDLLIKQIEIITKHKIVNYRIQHDFFAVLESLIDLIDAKDPYSAGHSKRVSYYAEKIAEVVQPEQKTRIRLSALLHDIGKLKIPKEILIKNGKLTEPEYELIKLHPVYGFEMLINLKGLDDILDGVLYHHERLDGSGYPYGITGASIPNIARIIHVADMYDAMTSDRPYRKRMTSEQCFAILKEEAEKQKIDSKILNVLISIVRKRKNEKI